MPAEIKPKFWTRENFFNFLPGVDASLVYMRAWALGCFHSLTSTTDISEGAHALTASLDSCAEIKSAPSVA